MTVLTTSEAGPMPTFDNADIKGDSFVLTVSQLTKRVRTKADATYNINIPNVTIKVALGISFWGFLTSDDAIAIALIPPYVNTTR
jgi:hypothetical protein